MNSISQKQNDGLVECEVCLKEIPISEAKSEEASGYVAHYFGLECYAIWKAQPQKANEQVVF
jgi:hypothetical protein